MKVAIVDSGVANLASINTALRKAGADTVITSEPQQLAEATHIVVPGVGAFGAGIAKLRSTGLAEAICEQATTDKPLLAICLGMQMLADSSDECTGIRGLGIISGHFQKLPSNVRVPQLGWNSIDPDESCHWLDASVVAYANSYCLKSAPDGWSAAWTTHGDRFVAGLERGRILACQFHPELSGAAGIELIHRWLHNDRRVVSKSVPAQGEICRIVPCLDVRDGRVVKGIQFQNLRDSGDPAERAGFYEQQGADEIVVLDVGATPGARDNQLDTVRRIRAELSIPLTVGGGVRSIEDARRILNAGADKVGVNTAAVRRPELLRELATEFGCQCIVLSIDARRTDNGWEALTHSGSEGDGMDAVQWAQQGEALGAGEILLTSWDRDGTREGCDEALLTQVSGAVSLPIIASGGIGNRDDVAAAFRAGANAVLAASIFHFDEERVDAIKHYLRQQGFEVRL